jgi:transcriptional regulator with XRE-family HTH domain
MAGAIGARKWVGAVLGDFLRDRRKAARLSQTDLAERTGIPQTYISRIERGEVGLPQRATREKFHAALGTTERDWLDAAGEFGAEPGDANGQVVPPPLPASPARDADWVPIAQKVADVESRRGEHYQRRLQAARERMSRADYEAFCAALWGMWEGNSLMVFQLLDRDGGGE